MYKFCFVILHYEAVEETINCVNSITERITYNNYSIVIVDNNSPNKSGVLLLEKYKETKGIYVLLNNANVGFARGNNFGYEFAKEQLKADFIICINNDMIIQDPDFVQKIISSYEEVQYHVMGPDIITITGDHQNPYKMKPITLEEINTYIQNYKKDLFIALFRLRLGQIKMLKKIYNKFRKPRPKEKNVNYTSPHENVVLHGSAIVFSPLYIKRERFAFHPGTFMYEEEQVLYYYCRQKGYKIYYSPVTTIIHKEDASTNLTLKTNYKKEKFRRENILKSYLLLKNMIEK